MAKVHLVQTINTFLRKSGWKHCDIFDVWDTRPPWRAKNAVQKVCLGILRYAEYFVIIDTLLQCQMNLQFSNGKARWTNTDIVDGPHTVIPDSNFHLKLFSRCQVGCLWNLECQYEWKIDSFRQIKIGSHIDMKGHCGPDQGPIIQRGKV